VIEESKVIATLAEALMIEPDELQMDTELENLPAYDSVSRLTLMVALSDLTGQNVEPSVLQSLKTCRDVVAFVNKGQL
jgi:acyl carrier protein